jgi:chromosome segregation protein
MLLSKLEIKGFKSFGDKMVIHFDKGITGVVGPNGCGKSNVVDAIRWVLGEQKSRMLRSDKMENVIFNGTKNRKPTNLAEVSLTFENTKNLLPTEYTYVTITRRYYRSGESEYQINGVTCRLKDITNLFLDTGINSNSYAIIELKMIDELLNDKNNSRRELFEEAAGISKFKNRKRETLRKLEDTDADLSRVEDLLFEIDKNLKSLEKQAKQAARYFEIKADYRIASINLAKKSLEQLQLGLVDAQTKIQQESDHKLEIQSKIVSLEAQLSSSKSDLIGKEKLLASRQKALNEQVNKIRTFESDKKI